MTQRVRVSVAGAVQGVGFRPFVARLATELELTGFVRNTLQGVTIEVEGAPRALDQFLLQLRQEPPARAVVQSVTDGRMPPRGDREFTILESMVSGARAALVLPDLATCAECVAEIFTPQNRRYRYPFTNCIACGPRFSILTELPYDRANTSMRRFTMCAACAREYRDLHDRRFHAQPNACPECGPQLALWDAHGMVLAERDAALQHAADALRAGAIVAMKGLGGFHLLVDARHEQAVAALRARKRREAKPFAVMFPSFASVHDACEVSALEEQLLLGSAAPIVLLRARRANALANAVAPQNHYVGAMLPYTPLHHLLLAELAFPLVATSGNLAEEPICIDEHEALDRLGGIADRFLVHDRPIVRHVDDSVVRVVAGRELCLRRARGFAPLPVASLATDTTILALGGQQKNTTAIATGHDVIMSQHIGDLATERGMAAFRRAADDLPRLHAAAPTVLAVDLHPDYAASRWAQSVGARVIPVQHHHAHVLACMAENDLDGAVLGVAWDGSGFGPDGTVWGGEFLACEGAEFRRIATLRSFALPGGESAVREPRRTAAAILYEMLGRAAFARDDLAPIAALSAIERRVLCRMLEQRVNTPRTSSAGRLFAAVAALIGLRQQAAFEGQAAMDLEHAIQADAGVYQVCATGSGLLVLDWQPMLAGIIADLRAAVDIGRIAARFHNTLVRMIVAVAERAGLERVALSGGCFQNAYLLTHAVQDLAAAGFRVFWHRLVPPNDGGLALGQAVAVARLLAQERRT